MRYIILLATIFNLSFSLASESQIWKSNIKLSISEIKDIQLTNGKIVEQNILLDIKDEDKDLIITNGSLDNSNTHLNVDNLKLTNGNLIFSQDVMITISGGDVGGGG